MKRSFSFAMRIPLLVLVILIGAGASGSASDRVTNPQNPASAANTSTARFNATDGVIKFYQWRVTRDPDDFFNYDRLGGAYIQKARETGDITYYSLAEASLKKSLQLESKHREAVTALTHLATVYFGEHRFADALDYANRAIALGTGDVSEYAIVGDTEIEMGDYRGAAQAYAKLNAVAAHGNLRLDYLQATRFASLDFLHGRSAKSIHELKSAIATAARANVAAENIAWTQFMLGEELFLTGNSADAETSYREALKSYPGYHRALAGLAKIEAAHHHFDKAAELYNEAIARIPLPIYAAALGDIYIRMGRPDDARKQFDLVEYIARINALNQTVYNRELALFYADHDLKLADSVALARKELELRRDIYSWDVLAFALFKNGEAKAAAEADAHAMALGTEDPLLFYHAGMIQRAAGNDKLATRYLRRALALNPEFHVLYADLARSNLRAIEIKSARAASDSVKTARREAP